MPRKPIPARVNVMLDHVTMRSLDMVVSEVPDVSNRSAAIRYLTRLWREERDKARLRAEAEKTGGETLV